MNKVYLARWQVICYETTTATESRFLTKEGALNQPTRVSCVVLFFDGMIKSYCLEPPDTHFLSAAEGWMELGDCREALAELERISQLGRDHFEVMQVRWHVHNRMKEWSACLYIGRDMIEANPELPQGWINHGNALFYLNRYKEAFDLLLPMLDKFPNDEAIPYNLACYKCQAGDLMEAKEWLERALAVGDSKRVKTMASTDPDLKPLWESGDPA